LLAVSSRIPVDVLVKGRRIGTSDGGQMVLASGVHRLELVNRRFNYRDFVSVRIEPGGLTSHAVALPYGSVRVETTPGAEIFVEGQRMGQAPLEDLAVPIGTREVIVRSADRRERRQPVEVRVGEVAVINAEFEPMVDAAEAAAGMPTLQAPRLHIIR
jgi:serine/threonine-protein kinase